MLKEIDKMLPLPKYYQISESIKVKITSGEFASGDRIPTYQVLTEYFNTTMPTVCNAVRQLEADGYIYKARGKGMFVTVPATASSKAGAGDAIRKVGLTIHTRGDLHQNLSEVLIHDLEKHDIYTIPQPPVLSDSSFNLAEKEKCLKKYIANGLESLVLDGSRHIPYKLLYKYRESFRQLNFLMHYESGIDFPAANIILCDPVKAGRLAAKHLIKAGREKFVFITFDELPEVERKRNGCRDDNECYDMLALSGMKAVLQEAGFSDASLTVIRQEAPLDEERNVIKFSELLKQGACGIFSMGDFRTVQIYRAATRMGLDFTQNLSIVGCYNTSWTEVLHPKLTSISIDETEIAHHAANCIINCKTGQRIIVEPKLIVRET